MNKPRLRKSTPDEYVLSTRKLLIGIPYIKDDGRVKGWWWSRLIITGDFWAQNRSGDWFKAVEERENKLAGTN